MGSSWLTLGANSDTYSRRCHGMWVRSFQVDLSFGSILRENRGGSALVLVSPAEMLLPETRPKSRSPFGGLLGRESLFHADPSVLEEVRDLFSLMKIFQLAVVTINTSTE